MASLCGIEKAGFENDPATMEQTVRFDLTLHAMMFMQTGLSLLYSGDELAHVNDYSYKEDPQKAEDSRYLHHGKFRWELAEHAHGLDTPEGQVFCGLGALRKTTPAFDGGGRVDLGHWVRDCAVLRGAENHWCVQLHALG